MCPMYDYVCTECQHLNMYQFSLKDTRPETMPCLIPWCGATAEYRIAAPMVLKASFLDGQRKKQFQDLREASKLNKASAASESQQEKKEIKQEMSKIGYNFTKDPV